MNEWGLAGKPKVLSAKRPKFSDHRGRTWDYTNIYLPNGDKIKGYLDTTWGEYVYFELGGKWKRISVNACSLHYNNDIYLKDFMNGKE